ncbi:MAG: hypothetical protein JSU85_10545 [Candidatus Zixiibacteriota bacterium]|nr:MAG: hypothetical protein JSU85_10545 [candidate division Zixibacteria bacterium]
MKPETESSGSKAKTERKTAVGVLGGSVTRKKTSKRAKGSKSGRSDLSACQSVKEAHPEQISPTVTVVAAPQKHVTDLEFLDTVKETVYKKLVDGELDLKIDSGFKAIELKNKISETSENERLLLEILSEIRSEELSKSK